MAACIDKYEASIWDAPVGGNQITGDEPSDYCDPGGRDCDDIYARSVPGVEPALGLSWFQAQAALANSGKRLPTSAEWQMAVLGTPDPGGTPGSEDCNTNSFFHEDTGERANCVSKWGHRDMVGNADEWVADWVATPTACPGWGSLSGGDAMCLAGADTAQATPAALLRGGFSFDGSSAGVFTVKVSAPATGDSYIGFRGAR